MEKMDETRRRLISFRDLPSHLIIEMLISGRLRVIDLVNIEMTSKVFGFGLNSSVFKSLADQAASLLCSLHPIFVYLSLNHQNELFERCNRNWKRVLKFLQRIVESSGMAETSKGNMQIMTGDNYTMVIKNSKVYTCGSNRKGVLGQWRGKLQCVGLTPIDLPQVVQVSASRNNSAFLTQSGEVFRCGQNYLVSCGNAIYSPELVESLRNTPCKQVATKRFSTVFLTREGHVYTVGDNSNGELGHGDTKKREVPEMVEGLEKIVHVSAGPQYVLVVSEDGTVYSFGDGSDLCLGDGGNQRKLEPHAIQTFKTNNVHILRVSAGEFHAAAIDSNGYVYTWGLGATGALGHGDNKNCPTPKIILGLKNHIAVQVCANLAKTLVVVESGLVYEFGILSEGERVYHPRVWESLRPHRVVQVSIGRCHTMVITQEGRLFGIGDNKHSQLGHHSIQECFEPTEIFLNCPSS